MIVSMPVCGYAQSHARFSVEPSNPALQAGVGTPGMEFTFTADVADARSYRILIDRARPPVDVVVEPDADSIGTFAHTFDQPGRYPVKLIAELSSGELVELQLNVRVEPPPSPPAPPVEYARFTVSQSDPNDLADFTFVADVSNAESYTVDFGDDVIARNITPDESGRATLPHRYTESGNYTAVMNALRNNGDTVEKKILVSATRPAALPSRTLFSVMPSKLGEGDDVERPWAAFTFTANITGATQYTFDFDFDDNDDRKQVVVPDSDGIGIARHQYSGEGTFDARVTAELGTGEQVTESLLVTVRAPAPVSQAPPVAPKRNWWPWILLALALALLLYTLNSMPMPGPMPTTGNHLISFEPRVAAGNVRISGSTAANESVSMRLRRDPGRVALAVNDGE